MVEVEYIITRLSHNAETISNFVQGVGQAQARWKPDSKSWSILEVINHLYDEEREDFRLRLNLMLHQPGQTWPPNNPEGWVIERGYNQRDFETSVKNFLQERQESIAWLQALSEPNWPAVYEHPAVGRITAGEMLAAWLAHDLLHLRQLVELHWAYLAQQTQPIALAYAGGWS